MYIYTDNVYKRLSLINDLDLGIDIGGEKLSILLYADDICLMTESEEKLQAMLDMLHIWCKNWQVLINTDKSKCMHFRKNRASQTNHLFKIGDNIMETVDRYKYLGVIFTTKTISLFIVTLSPKEPVVLWGKLYPKYIATKPLVLNHIINYLNHVLSQF